MAVPVAMVLSILVIHLLNRVTRLEARLRQLEQRVPAALPAPATPSEVPAEPPAPPAKPEPAAPEPATPERTAAKPAAPKPPRRPIALPSPEQIVVWIGAAFGALAVVLAALFSLVAAIENGWIGPSARIALGFVAGTGLWVGGAAQRRRWPLVSS